ncbi:MAG: hypothetical protein AB8F26_12620 [Phycisphaerales bacterium]
MMGCLLVLGAMIMPRILLVVYWITGSFKDASTWDTWWWPLLGFFFLPATTLVFGMCHVYGGGEFTPWWIVGTALAVFYDFSSSGSARKTKRGRRQLG